MSPADQHVGACLDAAVTAGVTPGCVAVIDRGGTRSIFARGRLASLPHAGPECNARTIYDLASLTKVLATTTLFARAISEGRVSLDDRPPQRWRAACGPATARDLLAHRGGLEAHREFFVGASPGDRESLFDAVARVPPATAPGPVVYSDLGFIVLGAWLESLFDRSLDEAFTTWVARPLGLEARLRYRSLRPLDEAEGDIVAPTEVYDDELHEVSPTWFDLRRPEGVAHGRVHDDNALIAGGVAGHAGLFGDAGAVADVAGAWLRAPGRLGIDAPTRARFFRPIPGITRRLGWDGPNADGSGSTGRALGSAAVGHLGFTGTSVWIEPEQDAVFVLLTNRVHPTRAETRIRELRRDFHRFAAG